MPNSQAQAHARSPPPRVPPLHGFRWDGMSRHVQCPIRSRSRYSSVAAARAPTHLSLRSSLTSSAKISKVRRAGKMYWKEERCPRKGKQENGGGGIKTRLTGGREGGGERGGERRKEILDL